MKALLWLAFILAVAWWLLTCDCAGDCRRPKRGPDNSPIARAPDGGGGAGMAGGGSGCSEAI